MSESMAAAYLTDLDKAAGAASVAEDEFRRNIVAKMREHEEARAFAFRRLNLMKGVAASVSGAKDADEANERGTAALCREIGWTGATEFQREGVQKFAPVTLAVWEATKEDAADSSLKEIERELAGFESWYAQAQNKPFMTVMEQELPELPLVEVF
jgi:hypothetical protein